MYIPIQIAKNQSTNKNGKETINRCLNSVPYFSLYSCIDSTSLPNL